MYQNMYYNSDGAVTEESLFDVGFDGLFEIRIHVFEKQ